MSNSPPAELVSTLNVFRRGRFELAKNPLALLANTEERAFPEEIVVNHWIASGPLIRSSLVYGVLTPDLGEERG